MLSQAGLVIKRDKSEILLLGNSFPASPNLNHTPFKDLKIKNSVKILGVYFTYDRRLRRKLNFDEITKTIKDKLRIWKWRDLTIIGRIQLVKTFIIPTFLYCASLICMDKKFVNEVNKLIFDFIWKGKDKVKRCVLVGDMHEDGGLKAPHLDSVIKTQRMLCCKKLASEDLSSWKIILLHYLKPLSFILGCNFDVKKLPIKLLGFYEECLKDFSRCSAANKVSLGDINAVDISKIILWNNCYILDPVYMDWGTPV